MGPWPWSLFQAYLEQAQRFKAANVHLYGMGVQTHFRAVDPNPTLLKVSQAAAVFGVGGGGGAVGGLIIVV